MKIKFPIAAGTVLGVCCAAFAQEGGHEAAGEAHKLLNPIPSVDEGIITGATSLVVFLIVLIVLAWKVWPAISRGLDERATKIRSEIEAAEKAQKDAKAALEQYERNLAQARSEAQKMLDDAKAQQAAISAEMRARNETELNSMRDKAKRDIDQAKKAAVAEVHAHATDLAMNIASKILQREIGPQDQQRLVRESLAEIPGAGRN